MFLNSCNNFRKLYYLNHVPLYRPQSSTIRTPIPIHTYRFVERISLKDTHNIFNEWEEKRKHCISMPLKEKQFPLFYTSRSNSKYAWRKVTIHEMIYIVYITHTITRIHDSNIIWNKKKLCENMERALTETNIHNHINAATTHTQPSNFPYKHDRMWRFPHKT